MGWKIPRACDVNSEETCLSTSLDQVFPLVLQWVSKVCLFTIRWGKSFMTLMCYRYRASFLKWRWSYLVTNSEQDESSIIFLLQDEAVHHLVILEFFGQNESHRTTGARVSSEFVVDVAIGFVHHGLIQTLELNSANVALGRGLPISLKRLKLQLVGG